MKHVVKNFPKTPTTNILETRDPCTTQKVTLLNGKNARIRTLQRDGWEGARKAPCSGHLSHDTWFTMPFLFHNNATAVDLKRIFKCTSKLQLFRFGKTRHSPPTRKLIPTVTLRCDGQKKYIHSEDFFFLPSRIRYDKRMRNELTKTSSSSSQNDLVIHTHTARSGSAATWEVNTPCRSRHLLKACKSVGKKLQLRCSCKKRTKLSLMDRG